MFPILITDYFFMVSLQKWLAHFMLQKRWRNEGFKGSSNMLLYKLRVTRITHVFKYNNIIENPMKIIGPPKNSGVSNEILNVPKENLVSPMNFVGPSMKILGVYDENLGSRCKAGGLQWKSGVCNENLVSNDKFGVSNENMGVSKENLWISKIIWCLQWIYLGLLWKFGGRQQKSGVSMKSWGSPMIIWGSPFPNEKLGLSNELVDHFLQCLVL